MCSLCWGIRLPCAPCSTSCPAVYYGFTAYKDLPLFYVFPNVNAGNLKTGKPTKRDSRRDTWSMNRGDGWGPKCRASSTWHRQMEWAAGRFVPLHTVLQSALVLPALLHTQHCGEEGGSLHSTEPDIQSYSAWVLSASLSMFQVVVK
jgi:hypothetical protein